MYSYNARIKKTSLGFISIIYYFFKFTRKTPFIWRLVFA